MSDGQNSIQRDDRGHFRKGTSGNPGGRTKKWHEARKLIDAKLPELIETAIFMALHGDMQAMNMLLQRSFPALKPGAEAIGIEGFAEAAPEDRAAVLVREIGQGTLDADTGTMLLKALSAAEQTALLEAVKKRLENAVGHRDLIE